MNRNRQRRAAFATLGCRLNQFETDALVGRFAEAGWTIVPFDTEAELYVINTCTITGKGEQKSRRMVNKARRMKPDAVVAVTGCSVEYDPERYRAAGDIDLIVNNEQKSSLPDLVETLLEPGLDPPPAGDKFGFHTGSRSLHTRAMIKIQDGCNNFCAFCIVPHVRGRAVSLPPKQVLAELERTVALGYREIVLTGVNISRYRHGSVDFSGLIKMLLELPAEFRLHLPSVEPDPVLFQTVPLFAHPKLVRHLHICIQSGSDSVLKRMRRRHGTEDLQRFAEELRKQDPLFNLSADIIVGFPGETDDEFAATVSLLQQLELSHIHTFKYSPRKGTPAATMPDQIPEEIKDARSRVIRQIAAESRLNYYQKAVGIPQQLLIEKTVPQADTAKPSNQVTGYSERYLFCETAGSPADINSFLTVMPLTVGRDPVRLICSRQDNH